MELDTDASVSLISEITWKEWVGKNQGPGDQQAFWNFMHFTLLYIATHIL